MFGILGKEDGVALSAPQVNVPLQFFIARRGLYQHDIIVNPTWQPIENAQKSLVEEACLSLPGLVGQVNRWDEICVNYENINGEKFDKKLSNFHAQVFQHEVDHLNGILFIDHMRG